MKEQITTNGKRKFMLIALIIIYITLMIYNIVSGNHSERWIGIGIF